MRNRMHVSRGKKIGNWCLLRRNGVNSQHNPMVLARCLLCNNTYTVQLNNITTGKSQQCRACSAKAKQRIDFAGILQEDHAMYQTYINRLVRPATVRFADCSVLGFEEYKRLRSSQCFYCGMKASGIDRFDNSQGYSYENCVSCCRRCNSQKGTLHGVLYLRRLCGEAA